ncbi:hypothetical protein H4219_004308, partial [Mycoemilia scoparia]
MHFLVKLSNKRRYIRGSPEKAQAKSSVKIESPTAISEARSRKSSASTLHLDSVCMSRLL